MPCVTTHLFASKIIISVDTKIPLFLWPNDFQTVVHKPMVVHDGLPGGTQKCIEIQTSPGAYHASCTMGTSLFAVSNVVGEWCWPSTTSATIEERIELYPNSPSGPS
jgi:hypothetical protein